MDQATTGGKRAIFRSLELSETGTSFHGTPKGMSLALGLPQPDFKGPVQSTALSELFKKATGISCSKGFNSVASHSPALLRNNPQFRHFHSKIFHFSKPFIPTPLAGCLYREPWLSAEMPPCPLGVAVSAGLLLEGFFTQHRDAASPGVGHKADYTKSPWLVWRFSHPAEGEGMGVFVQGSLTSCRDTATRVCMHPHVCLAGNSCCWANSHSCFSCPCSDLIS